MEPIPDYFVFDEEKLMAYLDTIADELGQLEELNKSEKDKTYNSIKAAQYAQFIAEEVPALMNRVKAFKNSIGMYGFYRVQMSKNDRK